MKKLFYLMVVIMSINLGNSQDVSVEKSVFGIQVGVLGTWIHHEAKLSRKVKHSSGGCKKVRLSCVGK